MRASINISVGVDYVQEYFQVVCTSFLCYLSIFKLAYMIVSKIGLYANGGNELRF